MGLPIAPGRVTEEPTWERFFAPQTAAWEHLSTSE